MPEGTDRLLASLFCSSGKKRVGGHDWHPPSRTVSEIWASGGSLCSGSSRGVAEGGQGGGGGPAGGQEQWLFTIWYGSISIF